MGIWITVALFIVGVVCVIKGGDFFVDSASAIAKAFGIPSFIIGATIVSIATTLPELIVSVTAAIDGKNDMAIGNAVGSVTANTAMIMALAFIFMNVVGKRKDYWKQSCLLILSAAVLWLFSLGGSLSIFGSIILLIIFAIFMYLNIKGAMDSKNEAEESEEEVNIVKEVVMFIVGAGLIVLGSQLLVNSGSDLALFFGVPERIIAVTLVAIGTSLPELVTTVTAILKKESSLSIGNIIGANLIDLCLILPMCSLVSGKPIPVPATSYAFDMPVCLGFVCLGLLPFLWKEKAYTWQGILMLIGYGIYLFMVI
ncbi:MAG: calcium/sodium antiporter [Erysipelotrichaceae bacterium]|nr:calcium/sodium antiporter [Erysipelotrichaceae bacterium]